MPKVTTKAPATPEPAEVQIDIAAAVKVILPNVKNAFEAADNLSQAKIDLAVRLIELVDETPDMDRASLRSIVQGAVAEAKGVKLSKVANSPKNGGDPTLYSFVSELLTVAMPSKDEYKAKVQKAIDDGLGFEKIKFIARTGLKNPKKRDGGDDDKMTADKLLDGITKLIERAKLADISKATIRDTVESALEASEQAEKE